MYTRSISLFCTVFVLFNAFLTTTTAQAIRGSLISEQDESPIVGALVELEGTDYYSVSNATGRYLISGVESGDYVLKVSAEESKDYTQEITVGDQDIVVDITMVPADYNYKKTNTIGLIEIEDLSEDSEQGQAEYSSLLTAGRDVFDNAAAYNLSNGRFRPRGLLNEYTDTYLNGMYMNDLDDGRVNWGFWGGLNDVLRARNARSGLANVDFAYGNIGGETNVDLRASSQWEQKKIVYTRGNRSYANRLMFTYGTGMQSNGWAFSASGSRRWGDQGYIEGTYYDSWSYFVSVDKKINDKHSLNLVSLGSPTIRGRSTGSVQEAYDLAGTNYYNPAWGLQEGKVRNSREYRQNQPISMLRHDWTISDKTTLITTAGVQLGTFGSTRLNWFSASDPRPDYYRKLPTFQQDDDAREELRDLFRANPDILQIDWNSLYQVNYRNVQNPTIFADVNGIEGNTITGGAASYVLDEQHFDTHKYSVNSIFQTAVNERLEVQGGAYYLREITKNYVILDDLLGADFALNWDDFVTRDFPGDETRKQFEIREPNRIVREGDRYQYDYDMVTNRGGAWGQALVTLPQWDLYAGGQLSSTTFWREGNNQNGIFPESSLGKSETQSFLNYGIKAGATYKISGRNYLYANGQYLTKAPYSRFAYLSPRTRDQLVEDLTSEKVLAGEIGYTFKYSGLKGRVTGFYTKFRDQIENQSLYFDLINAFGNLVLSDIEKTHQGIEFGVQAAINQSWSVTAAGSIGGYFYDNRPNAKLTQDNNGQPILDEEVYIRNFRVPGLPQQAFTGGINFNKNYWFANLNVNYFNNIYLDFYPLRRSQEAVNDIKLLEDPERYRFIVDQKEVEPQFTVDFFAGKSFRISSGNYLAVNLSIGNILNNQEFITGGFEQNRFDFDEGQVAGFLPRLFYSYGRNYSLNVSYRW